MRLVSGVYVRAQSHTCYHADIQAAQRPERRPNHSDKYKVYGHPDADNLPIKWLHLDQARRVAGLHQEHAQQALKEQQSVGGLKVE
jgi:hypothetical protein